MSVSQKYLINKYLHHSGNYDIQICQTLSSVFFYSKATKKIYASNVDFLEQSFLNVPLNGDKRVVESMICSDKRESVQLWTKDSSTDKEYVMTYYGFDGTQASKKLHSEYEVTSKVNRMASTSLLEHSEGVLFTYLYDTSSMFYNKSLLIDLRGPNLKLNFTDLVAGNYSFEIELDNKKVKKKFKLPVEIRAPQALKVSINPDWKIPKKLTKDVPLKVYTKWTGPLIQSWIRDPKQREWATILPRTRKNATGSLVLKKQDGKEMLDVRNGYFLIRDLKAEELSLVKVGTQKSKTQA